MSLKVIHNAIPVAPEVTSYCDQLKLHKAVNSLSTGPVSMLACHESIPWHDDGHLDETWSALLVLATQPGTYVETVTAKHNEQTIQQPVGTLLLLRLETTHRLVMVEPQWVALAIDFRVCPPMSEVRQKIRDAYLKLAVHVDQQKNLVSNRSA